MGREVWEQERAELRQVLDDLTSGKIRLENGQDEYLENLKRRMAYLDEKIGAKD